MKSKRPQIIYAILKDKEFGRLGGYPASRLTMGLQKLRQRDRGGRIHADEVERMHCSSRGPGCVPSTHIGQLTSVTLVPRYPVPSSGSHSVPEYMSYT